MKSLFFKLLVLISLVTFSCNSNRQDNESEEGAIILTIEGIEVLIREYPTDGDVIFKLNTGDECKVIKKGKEETIDGVTDFWYKIEYDGQSGWVFGAQSNLKQITEKYKIEFELIGNDKSLSFNTIKEISGEHYNEIPQEYIDETTNEKPKVELISKKFFVEKDVVKAFVFLGFRNLNLCHGCIGRTDAILYKKFDNEWIELDFFEDIGASAGGNGEYGDVSEFKLFGKKNICGLVRSSFFNMGGGSESIFLIGIISDKIYNLAEIATSDSYYDIETDTEKSSSTKYKFVDNGGEFFDLVIKTTDFDGKLLTKNYKLIDNKYNIY